MSSRSVDAMWYCRLPAEVPSPSGAGCRSERHLFKGSLPRIRTRQVAPQNTTSAVHPTKTEIQRRDGRARLKCLESVLERVPLFSSSALPGPFSAATGQNEPVPTTEIHTGG